MSVSAMHIVFSIVDVGGIFFAAVSEVGGGGRRGNRAGTGTGGGGGFLGRARGSK
jgi:hypothetical protein